MPIYAQTSKAPATVVTPADYGIPVDGVTDATTLFQSMLDSLDPGVTVEANAGDQIKITAPLSLSHPVTIVGGEYLANPTGATFLIAADDVTIADLTITGPGSRPVQESGIENRYGFIFSQGTALAPIARTRISRVRMSASPSSVVWLVWHEDLIIEHCVIDDYQYGGIMLLSPKRAIVDGNRVSGALMDAPIVNSYGIAVTDDENTEAGRAEDVRVVNNYVEGVLEWEGIDTHGGKNIQIIGNTIKSCSYGIALVKGNATRLLGPIYCTVVGNYINKGAASGGAAILSLATVSCTIASNTGVGYA